MIEELPAEAAATVALTAMPFLDLGPWPCSLY